MGVLCKCVFCVFKHYNAITTILMNDIPFPWLSFIPLSYSVEHEKLQKYIEFLTYTIKTMKLTDEIAK